MKRFCAVLIAGCMALQCGVVSFAAERQKGEEPVYHDGNRMTDEEFLGRWDASSQAWEITGKIDYSYNNEPLLKQAEQQVKEGNLSSAKETLLEYYQNRELKHATSTARDSVIARVTAEGIYTSETPGIAIFPMTKAEQWYEFDVTKHVSNGGGALAFLLHSINRDFGEEGSEQTVSIASKESEHPAYLVVKQETKETTIPVDGDMYIRGGAYREQNFGGEKELFVSEWWPSETTELELSESPVSSGTRQAHLKFDMNSLDPNEKIVSATLHFYGKSTEEGKEIALFKSVDNAWAENEITWDSFPVRVLSYRGIPGEYDWRKPRKAHDQFFNVNCRFWYTPKMFVETNETKDPWYARRAVEIFLDFIEDNGGLTYDWYDLEKRLNAAFRGDPYSQQCFWGALESDRICREAGSGAVLNGEGFLSMLKFMWQEPEAMCGPLMEGQININGLAFAIDSLLRYCTYFPEFSGREKWVEETEKRIIDFVTEGCYPDGGYRESTSNYDAGVLNSMSNFYDIVKVGDLTIPQEFTDMYHKLGVSLMGLSQLDKQQFQWGDGGSYNNMRQVLKRVGENTGDAELLYYGTDGEEGTAPSFTSFYLPISKMGSMRSGWDEETDVQSFLIGRIGGSHSHRHMNQMNVFGYGRLLLGDTGKSSYDARHPAVAWQSDRTESHNSVEVNEKGQNSTTPEGGSMYKESDTDMYMNDRIDTYTGTSRAYDEAVHTRKVTFVKNQKFFIVSDFMVPTDKMPEGGNSYNQTWHFTNMANPTIDEATGTVQTNFEAGGNISVIPVAKDKLDSATLDPNPLELQHASYKVRSSQPVNFNTILYPVNGKAVGIAVEDLAVDSADNSAAAFTFTLPSGEPAMYYASSDAGKAHKFGDYTVTAGTFYTEEGKEEILISASDLTSVYSGEQLELEVSRPIKDVAVSSDGSTAAVSSSDLWAGDTLRFYAGNEIKKVVLNGNEVPFTVQDGIATINGVGEMPPPEEPYDPARPVSMQYMNGYEDGTFRPQNPITRAEAAKIIALLSGTFEKTTTYRNPFSDVAVGTWFAGYVGFSSGKGLVNGYDDGTFRPEAPIIRAEFAAAIARMAEISPAEGESGFADTAGSWADGYVKAMSEKEIINGYDDGLFHPNQPITRAEAVKVVNSAMGIEPDKEKINSSSFRFADLDETHWAFYDVMQAAEK